MAKVMSHDGLLFLVLMLSSGTTILADEATPGGRMDCVFSSGSVKRPGDLSLQFDDIPFELCTHVIYDSIEIEPHSLIIMPSNPEFDMVNDGWVKFVELKKTHPHLKLLIKVKSMLTSELITTAKDRQSYIDTIVWFVQGYGMDGVTIMWAGYYQYNPEYADSLYQLFVGFRSGFAAAPANTTWELNFATAIDIDRQQLDYGRICNASDFVYLYGAPAADKQGNTRSMSPLNNEDSAISIAGTLQLWLDSGCPANKILLGVPFIARLWSLADPASNGLGAASVPTSLACETTDIAGVCGYFELCQKFNESHKWTYGWDEQGAVPYAFLREQWISYENEASVEQKGAFARSKGLAGVFGWHLDMDDYRGKCGTRLPLTKALWKGITANKVIPKSVS